MTLGAIFPDSDAISQLFDTTNLAVIEAHRGITHSLVMLPLFAVGLAAATRWLARRRNWPSPSLARLTLACATGIGSHILLDLINSWGTMIWRPLSNRRVVWDLVFVIDLTLTAIALAPQLAAWAYARREGSFTRRLAAWVFFSVGAVAAEWAARAAGFPFSPWVIVVAGALFAPLFFLPARNDWGFSVTRATWCRAGTVALVAYFGLCAVAHHFAYERVRESVAAQNIGAAEIAAIPLPPSLLHWVGLMRTDTGVYTARIRLFEGAPNPGAFAFSANAPPNRWIEAARTLPAVKSYLWFARFPVTSYAQRGGVHVVEFEDLRFFGRGLRMNRGERNRRNPFTYRVTFDEQGRVLEQGWADD